MGRDKRVFGTMYIRNRWDQVEKKIYSVSLSTYFAKFGDGIKRLGMDLIK